MATRLALTKSSDTAGFDAKSQCYLLHCQSEDGTEYELQLPQPVALSFVGTLIALLRRTGFVLPRGRRDELRDMLDAMTRPN